MKHFMMMLHPKIALLITCYIVKKPIDVCSVTPDGTPLSGAYIEKVVRVGEHILLVLDIPMCCLMGENQPNIEQPEARRPTNSIVL